jgi:hypothetical protein
MLAMSAKGSEQSFDLCMPTVGLAGLIDSNPADETSGYCMHFFRIIT